MLTLVIPAMDGCFFQSAAYLLLICWEADAAGDGNNPCAGGHRRWRGRFWGVAGEPQDSDGDKSAAAGTRQSFVSSKSTVEVALQSAIASHILVTPLVTCPSTRLSNDSAFIDIPNGYRRGRLVAILQESVKNSNGTTRLGWEAVRNLAENC